MTNNQTKCGIIYEKLVMQAGDDERIINYEWPYKESLLTSCYNKAKISGCIKALWVIENPHVLPVCTKT